MLEFSIGDVIFHFVMFAFLLGSIKCIIIIVKSSRKKNTQMDRLEQLLKEQKTLDDR